MIMVLLVIVFPAMVMHYKGAASGVDPNKVKIEVPQIDLPPPLDFGPPPKRQIAQIKNPGAEAPGFSFDVEL